MHAGLGFSGHGLTSTRVGGKILASLALGTDDEWIHLPVVGRRSRCRRTAAVAHGAHRGVGL